MPRIGPWPVLGLAAAVVIVLGLALAPSMLRTPDGRVGASATPGASATLSASSVAPSAGASADATTRAFQRVGRSPFTLTLSRQWLAAEDGDSVRLSYLDADGGSASATLIALSTLQVVSPTGEVGQRTEDFAAWLTSHPWFVSEGSRNLSLGSLDALSIDAAGSNAVRPKPPLLAGAPTTFMYTRATDFGTANGQRWRFYVIPTPDDDTLIVVLEDPDARTADLVEAALTNLAFSAP
jgi:hypothetical protein